MFQSNYVTVRPAYGRLLTTQKQVTDSWKAGEDFQDVQSGRYLNQQDAVTYLPNAHIMVRYAGDRKVFQVK